MIVVGQGSPRQHYKICLGGLCNLDCPEQAIAYEYELNTNIWLGRPKQQGVQWPPSPTPDPGLTRMRTGLHCTFNAHCRACSTPTGGYSSQALCRPLE